MGHPFRVGVSERVDYQNTFSSWCEWKSGLSGKKPQVPPLRFAPVGMTILLCPLQLQGEILALATELSSRPERSAVEGPAVSQAPWLAHEGKESKGHA